MEPLLSGGADEPVWGGADEPDWGGADEPLDEPVVVVVVADVWPLVNWFWSTNNTTKNKTEGKDFISRIILNKTIKKKFL